MAGRVAVVTGAGRGLGREFAMALAKEDAAVVVADINLGTAQDSAEVIAAAGGNALAVRVDVANVESTESMAQEVMSRLGRIDVLVNNAGLYDGLSRRPFHEIDPDEWDRVMAVNVKGTWLA
ncbi:MAG: SDR family NAD(P)-dependent oxidoreductase, partial [Chloroflexota bacterium]|nr:SDR family NAD(P)-dependent oxidoreductase [Chloroflexota bacterium]